VVATHFKYCKTVQEEQKKEEREASRNRFSSPIHHNLVEKLRQQGMSVRRNSTNGEAGGVPVRRNSTNEMAGGLDLEAGSGQMMTAGGRKCSLGGKSRKRNVPGSLFTLQKNMVKLRNSHPFLFIFLLTH
jgi:hypothetical protein